MLDYQHTHNAARRGLRRLAQALLIVALPLGCAQSGGSGQTDPAATDPGNSTPLGQVEAGLVSLQSCGELEGYVKAVALSELDKGTQYYVGGIGPEPAVDVAFGDTANDGASGGEGSPSAPTAGGQNEGGGNDGPTYSDTNNQVAGVDEADLVKTDGNHIYTVSDGVLRIVKSLPAADSELVSELTVGTYPSELFLHGDTLVLYGQTWGTKQVDNDWASGLFGGGESTPGGVGSPPSTGVDTSPPEPAPDAGPGSRSSGGDPDEGGDDEPSGDAEPASKPGGPALADFRDELRGQIMVMSFVDVSDRANPQVIRTVAVEGSYASARRIGSTVYTVSRSQLFVPGIGYYGYYGGGVGGVGGDVAVSGNTTEPASAGEPVDGAEDSGSANSSDAEPGKADVVESDAPTADEIKAAYTAALDAQSIDDWLPKVVTIDASGKTVTSLGACSDFYKPTVQQGLGTVSVLTVDLADPAADPGVTTTIGQVGQIYASAESIYVASYVYDYWYWGAEDDKDAGEYSLLHKFSIDSGAVTYAGSGKVPGEILNQFSMDEHAGYLRVATTERNWATEDLSSNGVYVLGESEGGLTIVGQVDDLALDERIYSARFMGDRGYVVTFKQVDPLFTLDLSDPTAPSVAGELKIPGFSTYIHPLGDNHLLTIGREAEDNGDWVEIQGVQLQIFDVSDIQNPTLAHKQSFAGGAHSEALYDHRAFNFFAEDGLLAIPYENYGAVEGGVATGGPDGPGVPTETEPDGEPTDETDPADGDEEPTPTDEVPNPEPQYDTGIYVFEVSAEDGLTLRGSVSHVGLTQDDTWQYYRSQVRRTLMIEGNLYSIGTAGMLVNAAADLAELAKVVFPYANGGDKVIDGGFGGTDSGGGDPEPTPAVPETPDPS